MWYYDTVALTHQLAADRGILRDQTDRGRPPRHPECFVPNIVDLWTVYGVLNVERVNQISAAESRFRLLPVRSQESGVVEQISE